MFRNIKSRIRLRLSQFFMGLLLSSLIACGGSEDQLLETAQAQNVEALNFLVQQSEMFLNLSSNSGSCDELLSQLQNIANTQSCARGGELRIDLKEWNCQNPVKDAQAILQMEFLACQDTLNLSGTLEFSLSWNETENTSVIYSVQWVAQGLPYQIPNLTMTFTADPFPTCSGLLIVVGEPCGVATNCSFCPL